MILTKDSLLKMEMGKKSKVALTIPLVDIMKLSLSPDAGNQVVIIQLRGMLYHKTVVQTVILRCWTDLYLIWFKSYATNKKQNEKKTKKVQKAWKTLHKWVLFYKIAKIQKQKYLCFVSCISPNYNLDLLSTSKWPSEPQFCERYVCRWQKFG